MQCLATFLLIISAVQWINADKSCSKENLKNCLSKFQGYFEDYINFDKKTQTNFEEFCHKLKEDSTCLQDATDDCKEAHPLISALTVILYNHVNQPCNEKNRETYMHILPCVNKHSEDFNECSTKHPMKKFDDEQIQTVCMDLHSMLCVAGKSRKNCGEDGESLAKILELGVKDKYHEVCSSGCSLLFNYYWILVSGIIAFLWSHKMKL